MTTYGILMIGWEFPPRISGGLGTACEGIVNALLDRGHEITMILPNATGVRRHRNLKVVAVARHFKHIYGGAMVENHTSILQPYSYPSRAFTQEQQTEYSEQKFPPFPVSPYLSYPLSGWAAGAGAGSETAPGNGNENVVYNGECAAEYQESLVNVNGFGLPAYSGVSRCLSKNSAGDPFIQAVNNYAALIMALLDDESIRRGYDVIHCHDWLTLRAGCKIKKATGLPLFAHVHSLEVDRAGKSANPDIIQIERGDLLVADKIIAVSAVTRRRLIEDYGMPAGKIAVVHNGIDAIPAAVEDWQPPLIRSGISGAPVKVLFLGRVTWQKGPEIFLRAARQILAKIPKARFIIAGTGDMLDWSIEYVKRNNLLKSFIFAGFLSRSAVEILLRECDILIVSSRHEPFGMVAVEAAQAGLPVIVPENAGVREVLKKTPAFPPGNHVALAEVALKILSSKPRQYRIIENNRRSLRNATWSKAAAIVEQLYFCSENFELNAQIGNN